MNEFNNPGLKNLARNLRRNMTEEERRLWYTFLRLLPVPFYRQNDRSLHRGLLLRKSETGRGDRRRPTL